MALTSSLAVVIMFLAAFISARLIPDPETPRVPQGRVRSCSFDHANCTTQGTLTLAFDDCPQVYTNKLLNIIKDRGAKATSFMNGHNNDDITEFAGVVKREYDEGHHANLVTLMAHLKYYNSANA